MKAKYFDTALKMQTEEAVEAVLSNAEIILQVIEGQFQWFEVFLSKNLDMMAKLIKKQAAKPSPNLLLVQASPSNLAIKIEPIIRITKTKKELQTMVS